MTQSGNFWIHRILSRMNSIHTFPPYFSKIRSNIIHAYTLTSSEWFFPSGLPTNILHAFLIHPMRATCVVNLIILLELITGV